MYYEVKQIGDAAYPLSKNKATIIPRSERLLFEQEVLTRPSARFKTNSRIPYCLHDLFTPRDSAAQDGTIILDGTPPFRLELSIKNLAASDVSMKTIEVFEKAWKIDLPSYAFKSIGPHLVTIESVQDTSHCQQAVLDPLARSIWIDVAETAAIFPFERRENFCVQDVSQFQLEGTPPWTIG
jgi:nucleoporin POM152